MTRDDRIRIITAMRKYGATLSEISARVGWCPMQVSRIIRQEKIVGPRELEPKMQTKHITKFLPKQSDPARAAAITAAKRAYWERSA